MRKFYLPILAVFSSLTINAADNVQADDCCCCPIFKTVSSWIVNTIDKIHADHLYQQTPSNDMLTFETLIRTYDRVGDPAMCQESFKKWLNAFKGPNENGPGNPEVSNDALTRLQKRGLSINTLDDLLNLDPITVLTHTQQEFIG